MRHRQSIFLLVVLLALLACERAPTELRLIMPKLPVNQAIAEDFVKLLDQNSAVRVTLVPAPEDTRTVLEALAAGDGDIAIVTDIMPFRPDIAAVMPLYPTILHVAYRKGRSADSTEELITGATVYAGPPGSSSRFLFERITKRAGLTGNDFTYVDSADQEPDVFVVFAPISPDLLRSIPDYARAAIAEALKLKPTLTVTHEVSRRMANGLGRQNAVHLGDALRKAGLPE